MRTTIARANVLSCRGARGRSCRSWSLDMRDNRDQFLGVVIAFAGGLVIAGVLYLALRLVPGLGPSVPTATVGGLAPESAEA
jgi:hypothetical protein